MVSSLQKIKKIKFKHFKTVSSTMDKAIELMKQAPSTIDTGMVVVSDFQTRGRGQYGKVWFSDTPGGLYYSFLLRPKTIDTEACEKYSLDVARVIAGIVQKEAGVITDIRPPNDVLVETKKISGTLMETSTFEGKPYLVVGIGLNLNQDSFSPLVEKEAGSLRQLTGKRFSRKFFINEFTKALIVYFKV